MRKLNARNMQRLRDTFNTFQVRNSLDEVFRHASFNIVTIQTQEILEPPWSVLMQ